jgi:hypothetical protein
VHLPLEPRGRFYNFAWLTAVPLTHPMQRVVLEEYRQAVEDATARVTRLTAQLADAVSTWSLAPQVTRCKRSSSWRPRDRIFVDIQPDVFHCSP